MVRLENMEAQLKSIEDKRFDLVMFLFSLDIMETATIDLVTQEVRFEKASRAD